MAKFTPDEWSAYKQGQSARLANFGVAVNPWPSDTRKHKYWRIGWEWKNAELRAVENATALAHRLPDAVRRPKE